MVKLSDLHMPGDKRKKGKEAILERFNQKIATVRNTVYAENPLVNVAIQTIVINMIDDLEEIVKEAI